MKKAAQLISKRAVGISTVGEVREVCENVLAEIYATHIDKVPVDQRTGIELILAIWTRADGPCLFANERDALYETDRCFIGTGSDIATFVMDLLSPRVLDLEQAKYVVAHAVNMAKQYSQWVGGNTYVRTITEAGLDSRVFKQEIKHAEEAFDNMFQWMRELIRCMDFDGISSEESLDLCLKKIKDEVILFRTSQRDLYRNTPILSVRKPWIFETEATFKPSNPQTSGGQP